MFRLSPQAQALIAGVCVRLGSAVATAGQASAEAYRATMAVHDEVIAHEDPGARTSGHVDIDRAIAFVRTNLAAPIDVDTLAGIAGMSRAHFSRLFKAHLGASPADFVLRERMERAAKLLADSRLSVKRVAYACGFSDPNYFSKVFRRTFETSPVEFRTTGMFASTGR